MESMPQNTLCYVNVFHTNHNVLTGNMNVPLKTHNVCSHIFLECISLKLLSLGKTSVYFRKHSVKHECTALKASYTSSTQGSQFPSRI